MKKLLIVESPTKAKTISRFLDKKEFAVTSSFGHVRDLPVSKMGIDTAHNFTPEYVVPDDKKKIITELKSKLKTADMVLFATDEDREGEAIAWHLLEELKLNGSGKKAGAKEVKRIVFHEITKEAVIHAIEHPRTLNTQLVDAQQARRILDRLVGYELSPFLWKTVARGLSAGRVQSAAVRLIVEKEEEIRAFNKEEYWSFDALFNNSEKGAPAKIKLTVSKESDKEEEKQGDKIKPDQLKPGQFIAKLSAHKGKTLDRFAFSSEDQADEVAKKLVTQNYAVSNIEQKSAKRSAKPPFTTSTLQQTANHRLGFSAKQTMFVAQKLYEGIALGDLGTQGLITYMRTDSFNLSEKFLNDARDLIKKDIGEQYLPSKPATYKTKSKGAQEAHEAIRPTEASLTPEKIKPYLDDKQLKLYTLIWQRAVASQMSPAQINSVSVDIASPEHDYTFKATGQTIAFDGFMKVYPNDTKEVILPELSDGQNVAMESLNPQQHFTQPPARYSEATLVKKLEELGIGRPSTYAPIISTVQDRRYVEKEGRNLKPTDMGEIVNKILVKHFPQIVDYSFTASMEDELDNIAEGKREWVPVMKEFYTPFKENLEEKKKVVSKKDLEEKTDEKCDKCGKEMVIKVGRFGKFLACSGYPDCKNTKPIENGNDNGNGGDSSNGDNPPEDLGKCPDCGKDLIQRHGRFGAFIGCSGYPDCKYIKKDKPKDTGVTCPKCKEGTLEEKRTRRGKIFYGCSKYPKCDQAYWQKPTGKFCETCKEMITETPAGQKKCSNKECATNAKKKTKKEK